MNVNTESPVQCAEKQSVGFSVGTGAHSDDQMVVHVLELYRHQEQGAAQNCPHRPRTHDHVRTSRRHIVDVVVVFDPCTYLREFLQQNWLLRRTNNLVLARMYCIP